MPGTIKIAKHVGKPIAVRYTEKGRKFENISNFNTAKEAKAFAKKINASGSDVTSINRWLYDISQKPKEKKVNAVHVTFFGWAPS